MKTNLTELHRSLSETFVCGAGTLRLTGNDSVTLQGRRMCEPTRYLSICMGLRRRANIIDLVTLRI